MSTSIPRLAAALAAALLVGLAPGVRAGPAEDAAFRALYPKAEAGNADAQVALGKIYLDGSSSAGRDTAKAMEYITRAANAGNKPAMRLMVDRVESRGIEMCMKLQQAGDNYCESRLPAMVRRMIPKSPTAASCKKLDDILHAGVRLEPLRFELAYCAALGFSAGMASADAIALMRTEASGSRELFLKTMDVVLRPNTPDWDPLYVEDHLVKAGLAFKDKEVTALFSRHGVTLEGCQRLDPLRRETLKQRPAVCRMAARAGDGNAALYVGGAYLAGRDYFPKDARAAAEFIGEAAASGDSTIAAKAFALMLTLLKSEDRLYDHLAMVEREISRRTVHMPAAIAALGYEFDFLVHHHANMRLDDITTIVALADNGQVPQAQKIRVAHAIDDILKDRGDLIKTADLEMLRHYRLLLSGEPARQAAPAPAQDAPKREYRATLDASASPQRPQAPAPAKAEPAKAPDAVAELKRLITGLRNLLKEPE